MEKNKCIKKMVETMGELVGYNRGVSIFDMAEHLYSKGIQPKDEGEKVKNKWFKELIKSVKQMKKIESGEMKPSRTFNYNKIDRARAWLSCWSNKIMTRKCDCPITKEKQMSKKSQKKNKYITPMNVHVEGLKYDLKLYQKQIMEFKKGIQKSGWNSSSTTLADFIEAVHNTRLITFYLSKF